MNIKYLLWVLPFSISSIANAADWQGQGEVGLVKTSGNTESENFNVGLDFKKEVDLWTHEFGLSFYQASADDKRSANSIAADYTAKYAISERRYLFGSLGYLDDDFDGFTEQSSASMGYGYHVIKSKPTAWEIGIGLGYRDTSELIKMMDGSEIEGKDLSGATLVLRSDYRHKITDNTKFTDSFVAEIGADNSFIENDAALIVSMNERFALKAGLLIRHNTDPAPGSDETDTISSINLVYNFN